MKYQLCKLVEGSIDEDHGFIVCVDTSTPMQIGPGVLMDTGVSSFKVMYTAVVVRPYEGEIVDAVVEQVRDIGLIAVMGPGIEVWHNITSRGPPDFAWSWVVWWS